MRVRAASMLGAQRPAQLAQVALQGALARVPGLAAEAGLPAAGVHSLALDPLDSGRLGFHLTCGWSGERTQWLNYPFKVRVRTHPMPPCAAPATARAGVSLPSRPCQAGMPADLNSPASVPAKCGRAGRHAPERANRVGAVRAARPRGAHREARVACRRAGCCAAAGNPVSPCDWRSCGRLRLSQQGEGCARAACRHAGRGAAARHAHPLPAGGPRGRPEPHLRAAVAPARGVGARARALLRGLPGRRRAAPARLCVGRRVAVRRGCARARPRIARAPLRVGLAWQQRCCVCWPALRAPPCLLIMLCRLASTLALVRTVLR